MTTITNEEIETCYICLENIHENAENAENADRNKYLICGCFNRYHNYCLETWCSLHNKCPFCKKKIINNKEEGEKGEEGEGEGEEENNNDLLGVLDDNIFYPFFIYVLVYIGGILFIFNYLLLNLIKS